MNRSAGESEGRLFNSTLETSVRTLTVLDAMSGRTCDLTLLTWLDYLVVHTGDVGGPASLHPPLPYRTGELLVRRPAIERGLVMLRRLRLVDLVTDADGMGYYATEDAYSLIRMMRSTYAGALRSRAAWLAEFHAGMSREELEQLMSEKLGAWSTEFSSVRQGGEARA